MAPMRRAQPRAVVSGLAGHGARPATAAARAARRRAADRRDGAQPRRGVLGVRARRGRAARAAPARCAGAMPGADGRRRGCGARSPRVRPGRGADRGACARRADRAAGALRAAGPRSGALLRRRGARRRACCSARCARPGSTGCGRASPTGRSPPSRRRGSAPPPPSRSSSCPRAGRRASSRRCRSRCSTLRGRSPELGRGCSPGSACRRSASSRRWSRIACGSGSASAASVCTPSPRGATREPSSRARRRPSCTARSRSSRRSRSPTRSRSACGSPPTSSSRGSARSTSSAPSCASSSIGDRGERSERVWLHPGSFDAAAVVDRVRWQLGEDAERPAAAGSRSVRISPEAVDAASHHAPAIFGAGPEERVHHALSRVQAMLGHRGVLTPAIGGGRWLAERQVLVPWGDRRASLATGARREPVAGEPARAAADDGVRRAACRSR